MLCATVLQVIWDHHDPFYLFAGTDGGSLSCLDVRSSSLLYTHDAHTAALSSLALSPALSGCLVTASTDRSVKLWDVRGHSSPNLVRQRLCKIGEVHCAAACPDEPLLFCVGGEFEMKLLNFHNDETVTEKFGISNTDLTDDTVSSPSYSRGGLGIDQTNTVKMKSRKTKTAGANLSPVNPKTVSKSQSAADKVTKKSRQSVAEQSPLDCPVSDPVSGSKVKKSKHLKNKRNKTLKTSS